MFSDFSLSYLLLLLPKNKCDMKLLYFKPLLHQICAKLQEKLQLFNLEKLAKTTPIIFIFNLRGSILKFVVRTSILVFNQQRTNAYVSLNVLQTSAFPNIKNKTNSLHEQAQRITESGRTFFS